MVKNILLVLFVFFMGLNLSANDNIKQPSYNQKAQTILETIHELEMNGYITSKNAIDAKKELVFSKPELIQKETPKQTVKSEVSWTEYLSLINMMKIMAIIFLLIAFKGVIFEFISLFEKIPQYVYQLIALSISLVLTFDSNLIWLSEAKYISTFGVIANIVIIGWSISTYEEFFKKLFSFISLNVPVEIVTSIYLTLYFALFSVYLDSVFLGVLTSIAFVSIFSFTMVTTGLCTYIGYDKEDFINHSLFTSLCVVVGYSIITIMGINVPYLNVFSVGIEYVLTIVLVVTLIIQTSFAFDDDKMFGVNVIIFVMLFLSSLTSSFLFNLEVIPSIINTGFLIFILGWLHYFTLKVSGILTMFVASITLYLSALLLEGYPEYFVTTLF